MNVLYWRKNVKYWMTLLATISLFSGHIGAWSQSPKDTTIHAKGWFADDKCATARAKSGVFTAPNPDCARKCLQQGGKIVFIAEQEKAVWTVANPNPERDKPGYYVELSGKMNESGNGINVNSVKPLATAGPACARKPLKE